MVGILNTHGYFWREGRIYECGDEIENGKTIESAILIKNTHRNIP